MSYSRYICAWVIQLAAGSLVFVGSASGQNAAEASPEVNALRQRYADAVASIRPTLTTRVGSKTMSHPAKEWQVWMAFHVSLNAQYQRDPQRARATLNRHGVKAEDLEAIISAGKNYQADMDAADLSVKTKVEKSYGLGTLTANNNRTVVSSASESRQTKSRGLEEMLAADGTIAQYDNDANLAVYKHKDLLRRSLDAASAQNLDNWVVNELAPKVREVDQMAPAPDPTGAIRAAAEKTGIPR